MIRIKHHMASMVLGMGVALSVIAMAGTSLSQPADGGQPGPGAGGMDIGKMLIDGLKSVEGCLGAESARFSNGKVSIFGWFEDAEAARRWYHHPVHAQLMGMTGDDPTRPKPLAHVPDGVPLMIIATIRPTDQPRIPGVPLPVDQIAIEIFMPAPGGAYINARLSPETFKVEHMRKIEIPAEPNQK